MTTPRSPRSFGRRQAIAFGLLAAGLLVVMAMNWLPDAFPDLLGAPRPGYWIVLFGGFAVAMIGAALSLRATIRHRRHRGQLFP